MADEALDFGVLNSNGSAVPGAPPDPQAQPPAPAPADPLAKVRAELADYKPRLLEMQKQAEALTVQDAASNEQAVGMAASAKKLAKEIEARRVEITRPSLEFQRAVNALCKQLTSPLGQIEGGLKRKAGAYLAKVEQERRKAEARAREEARKLQEALDAEAKEKGIEAAKVQEPVMPKDDPVTRTEAGSANLRTVWTFEVMDPDKVPRKYCTPDPRLIRQAVKGGVRKMAGVRIYQDQQVAIRT